MRTLLLLFFFFMLKALPAQNLVPNGSFEEYTECPDFLNQVHRATGWSRFRGSPDYFNACQVSGMPGGSAVGVPWNEVGYQEAATGDGYSGVIVWEDHPSAVEVREHLGTMLAEPLLPGVPVYISFKASPAAGGTLEDMMWTVEGAGVRFSMTEYVDDVILPLPNHAALQMDVTPMDTTIWYQISGSYVPDSAYRYVLLGNFYADSLIAPVQFNPDGSYPAAYVYLDDVCVSYTATDCQVSTSVPEDWVTDKMQVYPIPFGDYVTVALRGDQKEDLDLVLMDLSGRLVWSGILPRGHQSVSIRSSCFPAGIYVLHAHSPMVELTPIILPHVSP